MSKKISIIIPIYNMERYLPECLNSVLRQSIREIEIICINDGSTDGTNHILAEYASRYHSIRVLNQENKGVGVSRNRGIEVANGEYIAFMDPDDFYPSEDILEYLYNKACKHSVNICGGSFAKYTNGELTGYRKGKLAFEEDSLVQYKDYQCHMGYTRFIYKTEFLIGNKLKFPQYIRFQDPVFMVKTFVKAEKFYAVDKIVYAYRYVHNNRKNIVLSDELILGLLKGCKEILEISLINNLDELYCTMVDSLTINYWGIICKCIFNNNKEAKKIINELERLINKKNISKLVDFSENYILSQMKICEAEEVKFIKNILKYKKIIIYGAGRVGHIVYEYLKTVNDIEIINFAVSDMVKKEELVDNVVIKSIYDLFMYSEEALIILAACSNFHAEMLKILNELNFKNIYIIDFKIFSCFKRLPYISIL